MRARPVVAVLALAVVVLAVVLILGRIERDDERLRTWWVSAGADRGGDGSRARPFDTIAEALLAAGPGEEIRVGPGTYPAMATSRSGTATAPIHVVGDGARIEGVGGGYVVEVLHDHVTIEGFDISRGDILVRIVGASGSRLVGNRIHDAGSECVRLAFGASDNEIAHNQIERCGLRDFNLAADRKNGEAVYIGIAPEQLDDDATLDQSNRNWVHDNQFRVPAECVDIKEGAQLNRVERNTCTGGLDPEGAGYTSRGDETTFRENASNGNAGAGIRLGGDDIDQGLHNEVIANDLTGNRGYALKVERFPQGLICGNQVADNGAGLTNGEVDPSQPCPDADGPDEGEGGRGVAS